MGLPEWWNDKEKRTVFGRILLQKAVQITLRRIPVVGAAFEISDETIESVKRAFLDERIDDLEANRGEIDPGDLSLEQRGELLTEIEPDKARAAVEEMLGTPQARESTSHLPPAKFDELRETFISIPGNLRSLGRSIQSPHDIERALRREHSSRFQIGDKTPDGVYELERYLGGGGFGEVWAARRVYHDSRYEALDPDPHKGRRALKFCLDPLTKDSLQAEIDAILKLYGQLTPEERSGVVPFFQPNLLCDPPYVSMLLCEGGDLLNVIEKEGAISPERAIQLLEAPLRALAAAHRCGVAHRDIKPANILLTSEGDSLLSDFGLARLVVQEQALSVVNSLRSGRSQRSRGLGTAGTALYMAPEIRRGEVSPDDIEALCRADVYSFGVTLYQLLTGNPALEGGHIDEEDLESFPGGIAQIIMRCTKGKAARRPSDASEIIPFVKQFGLNNKPAKSRRIKQDFRTEEERNEQGYQQITRAISRASVTAGELKKIYTRIESGAFNLNDILRQNIDEFDPDARSRKVREVLNRLERILGFYQDIMEHLDQLEDPSLTDQERTDLMVDVKKKRGLIYELLLRVDLNFNIIELISAQIKAAFESIALGNKEIREVIMKTMMTEDELRRIVKRTKKNSPEAKALQQQYGFTIDQLIKMDKRVRTAQRHIKRLEREKGNNYEELSEIVDNIAKGEKILEAARRSPDVVASLAIGKKLKEKLTAEEERSCERVQEQLNKSIKELGLSVRSYTCLEAAGFKTIRDLVQKTEGEMLRYRNFGRKSLNEIKTILKEMRLQFNMRIDDQGMPVPADTD